MEYASRMDEAQGVQDWQQQPYGIFGAKRAAFQQLPECAPGDMLVE